MYSMHALARMKQRGFCKRHVEFILDYGAEKILSGANVFTVTKRVAQKMLIDGLPLNDVERCKSAYVVLNDGHVTTVAHIY